MWWWSVDNCRNRSRLVHRHRRPNPNQVLQLQMNDYQYHYLFASPVIERVRLYTYTQSRCSLLINSNRNLCAWARKCYSLLTSIANFLFCCFSTVGTYKPQKDLETFDLEDFKYNFVNISAFRIVDAESNFTRQLLRDMEKFQPIGQSILNKSNIIQVCQSWWWWWGNYQNFYSTNFIPIFCFVLFCLRLLLLLLLLSSRPSRLWCTTASWRWPTDWPPWIGARLCVSPTSRAISSSRGMTDRRSSITSTRYIVVVYSK